MQTLKNKAFYVSVHYGALVRKLLALARGGFTNKHSELLESLLDDVSECKKRLEILEQKSIKELKQ
ncbi:hypothetical protein HpBGD24_14880 [Helicobacter pylori]|uniref:hypothetical protein n=1 Tax=Helicobacter pylori TaxID=210 RepID=UPI0036F305AF